MLLTKPVIAKLVLPPGKHEAIFFDKSLPGFGLRIRAGGKRVWIVQYRVGSKQRRITLGSIEKLGADDARREAKKALSKANLGRDPQSEKLENRKQASLTLGPVSDQYLVGFAQSRLKAGTLSDVRRYLQKHWAPLKQLPLNRIGRADVSARLAEIARDSGLFAANRARAALSALFSWAIGEGLAEANPVLGTHKATEEVSRHRVLSDLELSAIWHQCEDDDHGRIVRLLILTGQRREEIGGMLWSELDLNEASWRIGPERSKNGMPHEVPLCDTAIEILRGVLHRDNRDFVFGSGDGPFQGWSKAKAKLDRRVVKAKEVNGPRATLTPWRLHDLRRTVATRMADLGVMPHVIEAVLNHVSGHKAGVAGVYNRATYAREKREALKLWGEHLIRLSGKS